MQQLFSAASIGNYRGLEIGLVQVRSNQFDINQKNEEGDTLLHCAIKYASPCEGKKRDTVLKLIQRGANPNITDASGKTCFDLLDERRKDSTEEWIRKVYEGILIQITPNARMCSDTVEILNRIKLEEEEVGGVFLDKVYDLKGIPRGPRFLMNKKIDKASVNIDKGFLTEVYENVRRGVSQIGEAFLDEIYQEVCKQIDGGLQVTVRKLEEEINRGIKGGEIMVGLGKDVYDKMCNNLPQRKPHALQEISLLAIGTAVQENMKK